MSDRKKGYQHEKNRTADLIEDYLDHYEKHTSTNRRIPKPTAGQPSSSKKKLSSTKTGPLSSTTEKRSLHSNAIKFDPRVEDVALKPTTTQSRTTTSSIKETRPERSTAENRLRNLLKPHYPNSGVVPDRASSVPPNTRNLRRNSDDHLYSSDRTKKLDQLRPGHNKDSGWQDPNITRKSILRHSISTDSPRRYKETIDSSSSADSFYSDKRVRFEDQIRLKRKIAPSPELVQLVRTDSDNSLASSSSGNLHSTSEVSVSSGTGSLQDLKLVDYSLGSNSGSRDASHNSLESQGSSGRQVRQYSSNDSDYSTENESLYGIDKLRKYGSHYSSSDSFKSSAYSSSSSVKSPQALYSKGDLQSRPRIKSESSEDEPVQRRLKKITLNEFHAESDEDAKSDGSNSTLTDSSASESEVVLPSGIVITREKFTSGSEFESSAESAEDNSEVDDGSWYMTVKEHRASSPNNFDEEEQVMEKEIYFKYKESRKGLEVIEQGIVPEAQFILVENVEFEEVKQVKRPIPRRPKPIKPVEIIVQSVSDSESDIVVTLQEEKLRWSSKSPKRSDLESLKSVTLKEGEMDDLSESSISLTYVTTLDGSLTQTSLFTLPIQGKHSPNLADINSAPESSDTSSTRGVHAPYHLVKQIVKQNEALLQLQKQGKLNKLVSYSLSSLSSNGTEATESLVSLVEDNDPTGFAPRYFYDCFGIKKQVRVSTGTSTVFGSGYSLEKPYVSDLTRSKLRNDDARRTYFHQRATQTASDIGAEEVILLNPVSWKEQKTMVSTEVQTDLSGSRRLSLQKQASISSAFDEYSKSPTSVSSQKDTKNIGASISDTDNLISSIKSYNSQCSDEHIITKQNFVNLHETDRKDNVIIDSVKNTRKIPNKKFAYKKEKKEDDSEIEIAAAGDGKFVQELSITSGTDSVISFHECYEEIVSETALLESSSSDQSSDGLGHNSSLSSDTEELRVSLKLSRDLSKSGSNVSAGSSEEHSSCQDSTSRSVHCLEAKERRPYISAEVITSTTEEEPSLASRSIESPANSSVHSADQRMIEMILNEVEEMIIESKECSIEPSTTERKDVSNSSTYFISDYTESHDYSERDSCYSLGEIVKDPKNNILTVYSSSPLTGSIKSAEQSVTKMECDSTSSPVDRFLLHLKDKSSSASSSLSGSLVSINKSSEKPESEFERIHREMKEMFDSDGQKSLTSKNSSSSTLHKIPSIRNSVSHRVGRYGSGLSIEHETTSTDEEELDRDKQEDSDEQVIIETTSDFLEGKSVTSSRFRRKIPANLSSYGAISDPEAILRLPKLSGSSDVKETSRLVKSQGSNRSKHGVPRLSSLSTTQKCTDIGIVTSNKAFKRDQSRDNSAEDSSDNKVNKKPSTRTTVYSSKLRASSGEPGLSNHGGGGLVKYDHTADLDTSITISDDELSPDELEVNDLVYSMKFSKPSQYEEDIIKFCENCRSEECEPGCESSNTNNSEMTEFARYKRGRWADDYGVLRALKWVFCPCGDA